MSRLAHAFLLLATVVDVIWSLAGCWENDSGPVVLPASGGGRVLLLCLARRAWALGGLLQGRLVYAGTGGWARAERPSFSRRFLLAGSPDCLVVDGCDTIPVWVKPWRAGMLVAARTSCVATGVVLSKKTTGSELDEGGAYAVQ